MTTAIVLPPGELELFRRVVALRAANGAVSRSEAGVERPYSVSALIRELLDAYLTDLADELRAAGIDPPE